MLHRRPIEDWHASFETDMFIDYLHETDMAPWRRIGNQDFFSEIEISETDLAEYLRIQKLLIYDQCNGVCLTSFSFKLFKAF